MHRQEWETPAGSVPSRRLRAARPRAANLIPTLRAAVVWALAGATTGTGRRRVPQPRADTAGMAATRMAWVEDPRTLLLRVRNSICGSRSLVAHHPAHIRAGVTATTADIADHPAMAERVPLPVTAGVGTRPAVVADMHRAVVVADMRRVAAVVGIPAEAAVEVTPEAVDIAEV